MTCPLYIKCEVAQDSNQIVSVWAKQICVTNSGVTLKKLQIVAMKVFAAISALALVCCIHRSLGMRGVSSFGFVFT